MPNFVGRSVGSLLSPGERDDLQWFLFCTHGSAGIPGVLDYVSTADAGLNGVVMAQSISSGSTINPNTYIHLTVAFFNDANSGVVNPTVPPAATNFIPPLI
jgi:hypothetical protein